MWKNIIRGGMIFAGIGVCNIHAQEQINIETKYSVMYQKCRAEAGSNGPSDREMASCAWVETELWDKKLNIAYRTITSSSSFSSHAKDELKNAQRSWIQYRDNACSAEADLMAEGGTAALPIQADCVLRMTALRAIELEHLATLATP